ncbi:hypothetical protein KP803_10960 [Vibrio sp. ZSDE26]|uniref:Uncharacterized protein n=1 Tax=Vibrio amylolyticus TaxID=2847292 RepID=A0A9X1XJ90_9VIBR|nr:hypothetical protein [Vibrio amylolyticus]MCK6263791.1 hypothetical protein [Vibrio amylolyticus]
MGSTTLITYLDALKSISMQDKNDHNINEIINEFGMFPKLYKEANPTVQINAEFNCLQKKLDKFIDEAIASEAAQIAADAAMIGSIFSFGIGVGAWVVAESVAIGTKLAASADEKDFQVSVGNIDSELNKTLPPMLGSFSEAAKNNNSYLAGLFPLSSAELSRSIFYQFMGHITSTGEALNVASFRENAEVARHYYESDEIDKVYDILDSVKNPDELAEALKNINKQLADIAAKSPGVESVGLGIGLISNLSTMIFARKFSLSKAELSRIMVSAGIEGEVGAMAVIRNMSITGKVAGAFMAITVIASVVIEILSIISLEDKRKKYQNMLNDGKSGYLDFYTSLIDASKKYADDTSDITSNTVSNTLDNEPVLQPTPEVA